MDGIQVYLVVLLTMGFTGSLLLHGKLKSDIEHNFFTYIFTSLFYLPLYGRIFGWW